MGVLVDGEDDQSGEDETNGWNRTEKCWGGHKIRGMESRIK